MDTRVLLIVPLLWCSGCASFGEKTPLPRVHGRVVDQYKRPLPGAVVIISRARPFGLPPKQQCTQASELQSGNFECKDLDGQPFTTGTRYRIVVEKTGFIQRRPVERRFSNAGEELELLLEDAHQPAPIPNPPLPPSAESVPVLPPKAS